VHNGRFQRSYVLFMCNLIHSYSIPF
jgi:hypothetical protein